MSIRHCSVRLLLLAGLPACGSHEIGPSLGHYLGEMDESIAAVEASLASHHDAVLDSTELDAMHDLEREHMEGMATSMDHMERARRGMMLCGEHMRLAEDRDDLGPLVGPSAEIEVSVDAAWDELVRHWRAMDEAPSAERALDEERGHRDAMRALTGQMRAHHESMADAIERIDGGSMMCPRYTHMHGR
jgi:hypothetical protein